MNKWEEKFADRRKVTVEDMIAFMTEEEEFVTEERFLKLDEFMKDGLKFFAFRKCFFNEIYDPYCRKLEENEPKYNGHIYLMTITDEQENGEFTHAFKIGETTMGINIRAQQISATNYFGERNQINVLGYYDIVSTKTERLLLESIARLAIERAAVYKFNLAGNDFFPCNYDTDESVDIYDYIKALFFNSMDDAIKSLGIKARRIKPNNGERNRARRNVYSSDKEFYLHIDYEETKMYNKNKWQNYFGV